MTIRAPELAIGKAQALGLALAIYAACALGMATALARFAYDGGSTGITVATTRALVFMFGFCLFFLFTGRSLRMPWWKWRHCAFNGFLMVFMFYGNIGAVEFIPVSLAALLFYTYPPMIVVMVALVTRERVPPVKAVGVTAAFLGLALMLGVSFGSIDARGAALSLSAALAAATNVVWVARYGKEFDMLAATFHMALIAAVLMVGVCYFSGGVALPTASIGWFGLIGVVTLQASTVPVYFHAITLLGALKSGMISNVQPLVSILAAYVLFTEVLTTFQFVGGAMVLGAVWVMQLYDNRVAKAAATP